LSKPEILSPETKRFVSSANNYFSVYNLRQCYQYHLLYRRGSRLKPGGHGPSPVFSQPHVFLVQALLKFRNASCPGVVAQLYFLALDSRHLPGARPLRYFRLEPPLHSHNIKNDKGPKTLSLGSPQDAEIMEEFIYKKTTQANCFSLAQ